MKNIFIAAVLLTTFSAHAEFVSGNYLLKHMNAATSEERLFASGYVAGVVDAVVDDLVCVPDGVVLSQVVDITKTYIQLNPKVRHYSAASLVVKATSSTWPCLNQPKKGML